MRDDPRVVFESSTRAACSDRSLVLSSVGIAHEIIEDADGCAILVPAEDSARAVEQLRLYDRENPPRVPDRREKLETMDPGPGVIAYLVTIVGVGWLAANDTFGTSWLAAGRIDGELFRDGEFWRAITAQTLHGSLEHLAGNIVFGALFGAIAGRFLGSGVAWLTILACAALGNGVNTLLLDVSHRSIGASTAVFAALGAAAGFAFKARAFVGERWIYRVGPIVGGVALLAYTGTGGDNTDIGAHLMGFASGFGGGMMLAPYRVRLRSPDLQRAAGASAIGILALSWVLALSS